MAVQNLSCHTVYNQAVHKAREETFNGRGGGNEGLSFHTYAQSRIFTIGCNITRNLHFWSFWSQLLFASKHCVSYLYQLFPLNLRENFLSLRRNKP